MDLDQTGIRRYWILWAAVVPLALWALLRACSWEGAGLLATAMFFTPWATLAGLLIAGVAVALRNWAAAVVAMLATAYLAVAVLPRAIGSDAVAAKGRKTLTVLSANVYLGQADVDALAGLVKRYQPDLLSIQELTPSFDRRLRAAGVSDLLPHSFVTSRPRGRGGGLYSRFRIDPLPHQTHFLFQMPRAVITLPEARRLRLVAVHPQPPNMSFDAWQAGLRSLPEAGRGTPWVLAGDFNGSFDQEEFRDVVAAGYRDAGDTTGQGLEPTWGPDRLPWDLITIDHVLADDRIEIASYGVDDLPGSDHRAIHAELLLPWHRAR